MGGLGWDVDNRACFLLIAWFENLSLHLVVLFEERRANEADDLSLAWADTPNVGFALHFPVRTPDEANTVQPSGTLAKESHIGEQ